MEEKLYSYLSTAYKKIYTKVNQWLSLSDIQCFKSLYIRNINLNTQNKKLYITMIFR